MNKRDQEISERIIEYLQKRQYACDTLAGISQFWMEFEKVDQSVDAVKNALDILVEKGAVIKIVRNGNMPIYKIARKVLRKRVGLDGLENRRL